MPDLRGKVALVAGATRGAGRGIACALGEAGATVYCTGRSVRGKPASGKGRPETIEETAEMVTARGGKGIAVRVDHTVPEQVKKLLQRIRKEQKKLHILVNDIWGGEQLVEFGKTFWKVSLEKGHAMLKTAVWSHIVTTHYAAPLLMDSAPGLIVEITDGDFYGYRGNIFYDLVKTTVIRLAFIYSYELRKKNIASVAVTPGFLRSEAMLEHFGVTQANWQKAAKKDPNFLLSETPLFVGRAIAHLAADPNVSKKSGRVFSSWNLSDEYGFTDADGRRPHWGRHFQKTYGQPLNSCDDVFYSYWFKGAMELVFPDWP
ncbi:MAG TPA: SDR family oxidoreductase [Candidatus Acidoferrales bacterium]|nr:SDR family oxidoreductase [Candidatus Acidoferrales bacterium]